jgi:FkbM family methyltransferase
VATEARRKSAKRSERLIYDVGMHNGEDTRFYLARGFEVLAVEAAPSLVRTARSVFREEIAAGQLTILECAVSRLNGPTTFYLSEQDVWNSVDPAIAGRDSTRYDPVTVPGRQFGSILAEFGVPEYLKVDIEGSDYLCINDLDGDVLPRVISVESECVGTENVGDEIGIHNLSLLNDKGYTYFKLVNQNDLFAVWPDSLSALLTERHTLKYITAYRVELERRVGWHFSQGSTGPWGDEIPGPWMDVKTAAAVYSEYRNWFFQSGNQKPYDFWCDWHAKCT